MMLLRRIRQILGLVRALPLLIRHYGSLGNVMSRARRIYAQNGLAGLKRRASMLLHVTRQSQGDAAWARTYTLYTRPERSDYLPKVSVIVPNYNHADYLRERLDSIYAQTYPNLEVILLDDASSDDSVAILREYAARHPDKTVTAFNATNAGSVFRQWQKGLAMATGELVWIAESDDFCTPDLIAGLLPYFAHPAVQLAFARTDFVEGPRHTRVWSTEAYLHDLGLDWRRPFIRSAHALVNQAWAIKNIVPNVSSALFRHPGALPLLEDEQWACLKLCGDWIFYLHLVRGGLVAYDPTPTNFYRQHPRNTSVNTQRELRYYQEHEAVARHLVSLYRISDETLARLREVVQQHWTGTRDPARSPAFDSLFNLDRARREAPPRTPNLMMASFGFIAGGGETFPITLANLLKRRGHALTFYNLKEGASEPAIRALLDANIPVLELDRLELTGPVCEDMGIEVVHSHHAWVDMTLAALLKPYPEIKQVVTSHGMYEMLPPAQIAGMLPLLSERISRFVYIADKNLVPFSAEFRASKGFVRIDNALADSDLHPVPRATLGIDAAAFVLCVVSRAIPEKGWEEAIQAVAWARRHSARDIQLLLVGNGPEYDRLQRNPPPDFVHLLGFRGNTRDYFACADMGLLPSRFGGESYPLVIIDCLHAGRPVLASRLGEIPAMLATADGPAGELFDLADWQVPITELGERISRLANEAEAYAALKARVPEARRKFDPDEMASKYESVYNQVLFIQQRPH